MKPKWKNMSTMSRVICLSNFILLFLTIWNVASNFIWSARRTLNSTNFGLEEFAFVHNELISSQNYILWGKYINNEYIECKGYEFLWVLNKVLVNRSSYIVLMLTQSFLFYTLNSTYSMYVLNLIYIVQIW